ncbi:molybdenum cofactor biosynthesis protein [Terasakiella brassicae]|uniref:Molybdenum cofactor biosynthesis protein n=1 Tax=Terasakiella brassicae TaxID=1634917 RepID=A0A917C2C6_9PROT|nr:molybdopterin-binding protein [Terasakiella brassicae]GGF65451.1 molybdenum cofactor biosynthesis protein [Terasakiella brassicae]
MPDKIRAFILIIGNEVLSGRTRDANLTFLANALNEIGIQVGEARVIPDDEKIIIDTVNYARTAFDYVFTTGGIGPTHDDITAACIAKAFKRPLIRNEKAVAMLQTHYRPEDLNEARLRMANTPSDAILIENPISKAPGFQIDNVFVLAGVPRIAQAMFENLKPRLKGAVPVISKTISTDLGEGLIAGPLGDIQNKFPNIEIGSYPYFREGKTGVSLVVRALNEEDIDLCLERIKVMIESLGGKLIFSV